MAVNDKAKRKYFLFFENKLIVFILGLLLSYLTKRTWSRGTWWNLGINGVNFFRNHKAYLLGTHVARPFCEHLPGMTYNQKRICSVYHDHMPSISRGAHLAIEECQYQFRARRWNCTTIRGDESVFGPVVNNIASRETAFTYSVSSAGVVHEISRACRMGEIPNCGCSKAKRPSFLKPEWIWGGCGDNIEYGLDFSRQFIDIKEKEKNYPRYSQGLAKTLMNLHNNEAGRRSVQKYSKPGCKCHGVSGSCSLRTCWLQTPQFRDVGTFLKQKYEIGTQVKFNSRGNKLVRADQPRKRIKRDELVYLEKSPDYCVPNRKTGSIGTTGRRCRRSLSNVSDGCKTLCCGRGYRTKIIKYTKRCKCKFHWCCYVKCQKCQRKKRLYTCV